MLPDPCTPRDIQLRLAITADWWAHNWRTLVARHNFPAPLPGFFRPRKWNPAAVETWIAAKHKLDAPRTTPTLEPPPANDVEGGDAADLDATLAARAAHLATNRRRRAAAVR
jgi:hypothetical protein